MDADLSKPADTAGSAEGRLDSWKEIAAHLNRHVTTVRRWEKYEGLPVHRHLHDKLSSVYAFRGELDDWWCSRQGRIEPQVYAPGAAPDTLNVRWGRPSVIFGSAFVLCCAALLVYALVRAAGPLAPARAVQPSDPLAVLPLKNLSADSEQTRVTSMRTVDPAAHQEYLIGRYHLWRDTDENLQRAIAHFQRATEIDPGYAAAYASLGHAWWKRGLWVIGLAATESPARVAAQRALHLDDALPEAYVVQAELARLYDRDLVRAEQLIMRALALQPSNVDGHYSYALVLMTLGRSGEAVTHMETAEKLEPLSPAIQSDFGRVLYRARRYDDAIRHLNRALDLEPAMGWLVYARLANVYEQMGQYDRALSALQRGSEGRSQPLQVARILARMGKTEEAKRLLEHSEANAGQIPTSGLAAAYLALGDKDRAFNLLFEMTDRRDPGPNFFTVDPLFDGLRSDSRWEGLLRRVSLPSGTQRRHEQ